MNESAARAEIEKQVRDALAREPIIDMHTHLYGPRFGTPLAGRSGKTDPRGMMLWGIDELLTYHYFIAEVFRVAPPSVMPYELFWKLSRREQADHVWKHLFVDRAPLSEACRGVLTTIRALGLDPSEKTLEPWRGWFDEQDPDQYIDRIMSAAGVKTIVMTNNVFDDQERERWLADPHLGADARFRAVLRIDPMLANWPAASSKLTAWGYPCDEDAAGDSIENVKRFLRDWIDRMGAIYLAASLPPEWRYPAEEDDALARLGSTILEQAVLPVCEERNLPFAMMIGATRRANPLLRDAGDMMGRADIASLVSLCRDFGRNRFFVTMLSRENQHELAVAARKFGNLMPFGCWWFVNNPSLIEEITRMRVELLGTSFIPQHSDARVLEQLLYKWDHSRQVIAQVLTDKFLDLARTGRRVTDDAVRGTVRMMVSENFQRFLAGA